MNNPFEELWGLLCPDCGPTDLNAIAQAALEEILKLRQTLWALEYVEREHE